MMKKLISVLLILVVVGGTTDLFGGNLTKNKNLDPLNVSLDGSYSLSGVRSLSSQVEVLSNKSPHEFDGAIKFTLLSTRGTLCFRYYGFQLLDITEFLKLNLRRASNLTFKRDNLYFKDLLKKGNDISISATTYLYSVYEGDIFRMPDNTEWKAVAIDAKKGRVFLEAKAITGTTDPSLKDTKNNRLILPLTSKVTLQAKSLFNDRYTSALYSTISTYQPEGLKSNKFKLVVKGYSKLEEKLQGKVIKNKEYENIKTGQKIELIPGQWHIIKKLVKPDPKKKTRGWIEFDTTPVDSVP